MFKPKNPTPPTFPAAGEFEDRLSHLIAAATAAGVSVDRVSDILEMQAQALRVNAALRSMSTVNPVVPISGHHSVRAQIGEAVESTREQLVAILRG